MSQHIAEVVRVVLEKHPNADSLSIAHVRGWQCVVKTSDFENINLGVYIPIDMVVPDTEEWKWLENRRVKTRKFRQALSQGLLVPAWPEMKLGDDVTEKMGITRYVPKLPGNKTGLRGGYRIPDPAGMDKYTDIENWKNHTDIFQTGEMVVVTEKIHGANARYALIDGAFYVGSHNTTRKPIIPEPTSGIMRWFLNLARKCNLADKQRFPDAWQIVADEYRIKEHLQRTFGPGNDVILYGEIYGPKVQKLGYGVPEGQFRAAFFDIKLNGRFLDWDEFVGYMKQMGLPTVPKLKICEWDDTVKSLADGQAFEGNHCREGVVIRPWLGEQPHPKLGRKIIKIISDKYLLKDIDENPSDETN